MQPSHDDSANSTKAFLKQGDGTGTRAAYLPVTPDIMLVSQAKGRGLVLRGVALHQQDATDQDPPPPCIVSDNGLAPQRDDKPLSETMMA